MKKEKKLCPQNFQVWVGFLMGMVVIIIAIVIFDNVSTRSRIGPDDGRSETDDTSGYVKTSSTQSGVQPASYTKGAEGETGAWLGIEPVDVTEAMAKQMGLSISGGVSASRVIEGSTGRQGGTAPRRYYF